jgi:hypothetical protein
MEIDGRASQRTNERCVVLFELNHSFDCFLNFWARACCARDADGMCSASEGNLFFKTFSARNSNKAVNAYPFPRILRPSFIFCVSRSDKLNSFHNKIKRAPPAFIRFIFCLVPSVYLSADRAKKRQKLNYTEAPEIAHLCFAVQQVWSIWNINR